MSSPTPKVPLVIAHRGASGYHPEHTLSAYRLAVGLGADGVEPDLVASSDGVLVIRHENEISNTTDVASRPEFAARRTTKTVDGMPLTGWFTEDFTWAELSTLGATEPIPDIRSNNVKHNGREPILRFVDLLAMLDAHGPTVEVIAEIKHASYFAGLGLHLDELFAAALEEAGWLNDERLTVESFELSFFDRIRALGVRSRFIYLIEADGFPADDPLTSYASSRTDVGLRGLSERVDGISVDKKLLLETDDSGTLRVTDLVDRAHAVGLVIFCWTLRAENRFLSPQHRVGGTDWDIGDWPAEFALILHSGIDGVFSDHPDLVIEVRDTIAARRASEVVAAIAAASGEVAGVVAAEAIAQGGVGGRA
ncbi:MAG: glycerophosphodiester phosphodiesterase [Burkholderiaceae bacterium]|nr:glycerophosphodiester phosphodiesterase [Microbacteriaceae bacterium]